VKLGFGPVCHIVDLQLAHTFHTPGVYLSGVRVTSQREGNTETSSSLVHNISRIRVVVAGDEELSFNQGLFF
jgi:hypothetical protein